MLFNWNVMTTIHSDCHDLGTHKVMLAASPPEILAESAVIGQLACQPWGYPSLAGTTPPWFSCRRIFSGHPALRRGKLSSFTKKSETENPKKLALVDHVTSTVHNLTNQHFAGPMSCQWQTLRQQNKPTCWSWKLKKLKVELEEMNKGWSS